MLFFKDMKEWLSNSGKIGIFRFIRSGERNISIFYSRFL